MRKRIAAFLAIVATTSLAVPSQALAFEESNGNANNVVVVQNRQGGAFKNKARSLLVHNGGPSVANGNAAVARASCTDCRTVAVAVQVVVLEGPVSDFRPENAAVALNETCVRCQTFAYARQEVLDPGRPVRIGDGAQERVSQIEGQIRDLASSTEPFVQLTADLDNLTVQLVDVVRGEVNRAGATAKVDERRQVDRRED